MTLITNIDPTEVPIFIDLAKTTSTISLQLFFKLAPEAFWSKATLLSWTMLRFTMQPRCGLFCNVSLILLVVIVCFSAIWLLGVEVVFLPAYSPELNPCELVFAQYKSHLRKIPYRRGQLIDLISEISRKITSANVLNYYEKCIRPEIVLPELANAEIWNKGLEPDSFIPYYSFIDSSRSITLFDASSSNSSFIPKWISFSQIFFLFFLLKNLIVSCNNWKRD